MATQESKSWSVNYQDILRLQDEVRQKRTEKMLKKAEENRETWGQHPENLTCHVLIVGEAQQKKRKRNTP